MNLFVNPTITGFRQEVDGTIKELKIGEAKEDAYANIIEQGGADLDNNKAKTIDVSTYTQPVEVLPTSGKNGMKKATITLSNIPSPSGVSTLYAWVSSGYYVYTTTATPTTQDKVFVLDSEGTQIFQTEIEEVGEGSITVERSAGTTYEYERASTADISLT